MKNIIIKILVFLLSKLVRERAFSTKGRMVDKQSVFLQNIGKLIAYAYTLPGYKITAGEMYRTKEQQLIYWYKKITKVKHSKHQDRLAFDINIFVNGVYRTDKAAHKPLAKYWKSLHKNNTSGYYWDWDFNHYQMT